MKVDWFPFCQTVFCFFSFHHLCDLKSVFFSLIQSAYTTVDVFHITVRKSDPNSLNYLPDGLRLLGPKLTRQLSG